ncbi:hypothetical protein DRJ16_02815, partial [Candidatus Woesearchaeota archaeon]
TLKIWKWNGSDWLESGWNGSRILDTANNIVGVNITSFSVFAPFGQEKVEVEEEVKLPAARRRRRGCFERWNCTEWGPCINGTQTRICYDVGTCKRPQRTETRECVVRPTPTPAKPALPKPKLKIRKEKPLPPAKPCKPPIIVLILIAAMFAHLAYCSIKLRRAPSEKEKRDYFDYIFSDTLAIVALTVLAYILCPTSLENIVILTITSLAATASIIWAFRYEAYESFVKRIKAERRAILLPEKKLKEKLEKEAERLARARKIIAKALKEKLAHEEKLLRKSEAALRKQLLEKVVPPTPTEKKKRRKQLKEAERKLKEKILAEAAAIIEPEKRLYKLLELEKARKKRRKTYERRKRLLEEKAKREAELRKKLEEKAREVSHTLNEFILKAIARGMNKQKIKTLLINAGWNAKFVEKYVDKFYKMNAGLIIRLRRKRHEQIEKSVFKLIDEIKEELKHPSIEKHYPVKISKKKKEKAAKATKVLKKGKRKKDEKSSNLIEKINKLIDHIDEELEKLKKF